MLIEGMFLQILFFVSFKFPTCFNRKLYLAFQTPTGAKIVQRDTDGVSNECLVTEITDGSIVLKMKIAYQNQT